MLVEPPADLLGGRQVASSVVLEQGLVVVPGVDVAGVVALDPDPGDVAGRRRRASRPPCRRAGRPASRTCSDRTTAGDPSPSSYAQTPTACPRAPATSASTVSAVTPGWSPSRSTTPSASSRHPGQGRADRGGAAVPEVGVEHDVDPGQVDGLRAPRQRLRPARPRPAAGRPPGRWPAWRRAGWPPGRRAAAWADRAGGTRRRRAPGRRRSRGVVRQEAVAAAGHAEPVVDPVHHRVHGVWADRDGHPADRVHRLGWRRRHQCRAVLPPVRRPGCCGRSRPRSTAPPRARSARRCRARRARAPAPPPRGPGRGRPAAPRPGCGCRRLRRTRPRRRAPPGPRPTSSPPWLDTTTAVAGLVEGLAPRSTTNPSSRATSATASATGDVPTRCRSGAGSSGSR